MAKHPHKLILLNKKTWKCAVQGCSFFVHLGLAHILVGKIGICWGCGEQFMIDEYALREEQPRCIDCRGELPSVVKEPEPKEEKSTNSHRTPEQQKAYDKIMKELGLK